METTRPESIAWFERLYIGSLLVSMAIIVMGWDSTGQIPLLYLIPALFLGLVLPVILILLVSRRRSRVAKWVLIALFAIGLASNVAGYNPNGDLRLDLAALVITAMQMLALALLFTAPARAWLAGKDEAGQTVR
ncbi:MAG TPA: hypothetical protein VIT45_05315 [Allosphingosinicella sp.]